MIQVLKQCGNDLSRENVMKQAANLKDFELPMALPGMKINTSPDNYSPIRQEQLARSMARAGSRSGSCSRLRDRRPRDRPRPIMALAAAAHGKPRHQIRVKHGVERRRPRRRWGRDDGALTRPARRSNGSRCDHSIVPAMRQSSGSSEISVRLLTFGEGQEAINIAGHLRPLADSDLLRNLEKGDRAHNDVVGRRERLSGPPR